VLFKERIKNLTLNTNNQENILSISNFYFFSAAADELNGTSIKQIYLKIE
jgi:hypothetical protein